MADEFLGSDDFADGFDDDFDGGFDEVGFDDDGLAADPDPEAGGAYAADDGGGLSAADLGERPSPDQVGAAFQNMAAVNPDAAGRLQREWGSDAASNLQHAVAFAQSVMTPELERMLNDTGLGNDPRLIAAAAAAGRRLAGRGGSPAPGRPRSAASPSGRQRDRLEARIDRIEALKHRDAARYKSLRVQKELRRLYEARYGNQPVSGPGVGVAPIGPSGGKG